MKKEKQECLTLVRREKKQQATERTLHIRKKRKNRFSYRIERKNGKKK